MKKNLEIEFIEGDVVAETKHEKLLLTENGIMISDDKGNQCFCSWGSFLPYYAHLRTLELNCKVASGVIEQYENREQ